MKASLTIHCIILTVNNYGNLVKTINSLIHTRYLSLSILVFDNGSKDNVKNKLLKAFPNVEVMRSPINVGFAEGNNKAVRYVRSKYNPDYYLLINNDATVDASLMVKCLPYLEHGIDMLSPGILLRGKRGVDHIGLKYYRSGIVLPRTTTETSTKIVSACCLFISERFIRKTYDAYGWLFNPHFVSYVEDVELALRAHLMGAKIFVIDDVLVSHRRSSTLGEHSSIKEFLFLRNLIWTIITVWPGDVIFHNIIYILVGQCVIVYIYLKQLKIPLLVHVYFSTIRMFPTLLKNRILIQKNTINQHIFDTLFSGPIADWKQFLGDRKLFRLINYIDTNLLGKPYGEEVESL